MPPNTAVPYKNAWVAIFIVASESGTTFPSKKACFERSTRHLQNGIGPALTKELYLIHSASLLIPEPAEVKLLTTGKLLIKFISIFV
jgi:hypothetical protein